MNRKQSDRAGDLSATRGRTRRAILDAAARVLSADRRASLGEVAEAAGVGRTTLHRYFPDRASLIHAVAMDSVRATDDAVAASLLGEGGVLDALERLVGELIEMGDRFGFLLQEGQLGDDAEFIAAERRSEEPIVALLARGLESGGLRADLPLWWHGAVLEALVYAIWSAPEAATVASNQKITLVMTVLVNGLAPTD